jgi:hypothetical protein
MVEPSKNGSERCTESVSRGDRRLLNGEFRPQFGVAHPSVHRKIGGR